MKFHSNSSLNGEGVRMVCPDVTEYPLKFWLAPDRLVISKNADAAENVLQVLRR